MESGSSGGRRTAAAERRQNDQNEMGAGVATSPHCPKLDHHRRVARLSPPGVVPGRSRSLLGPRPVSPRSKLRFLPGFALPLPRRVAPKGRGPCRVVSKIPPCIRFRLCWRGFSATLPALSRTAPFRERRGSAPTCRWKFGWSVSGPASPPATDWKLSRKPIRTKRIPPVDNEDIGHKSPARIRPGGPESGAPAAAALAWPGRLRGLRRLSRLGRLGRFGRLWRPGRFRGPGIGIR